MTALRFLGLLALLLLSGGPGLWLTRRLRWGPAERLVAALAASGIALYLTTCLIYGLRLPRFSYFLVSLGCLGCAIAGRAHARVLWASREVRWMLGGFSDSGGTQRSSARSTRFCCSAIYSSSVIRTGYTLNGRLLRPASVVISSGKAGT